MLFFSNGCADLHSRQICVIVFIIHIIINIFCLFNNNHFNNDSSNVALICISLVVNNIKYISVLVDQLYALFVEVCIKIFCPLFIGKFFECLEFHIYSGN
jgi:hypothetical protein